MGDDSITASSSAIYRLFHSGFSTVALLQSTLRLNGARHDALGALEIDIEAVDRVQVQLGWFWYRLIIHLIDCTVVSIGGLSAGSSNNIAAATDKSAAQRATEMAPQLRTVDRRIRELFSHSEYARGSAAEPLHVQVDLLVRRCAGKLIRSHLSISAATALTHLQYLSADGQFEQDRERANSSFVARQRDAVQRAARDVVENPLTEEQADAIATDEDATLVLAGAGTGKTAVIVGKVAHVVRNRQAKPKEVLVLAYNRDAVTTIRDRLPADLDDVNVFTFHAFGMRVLADATGTKPRISKLADDNRLYLRAIGEILERMLDSPQHGRTLRHFLAYCKNPYKSPFDFKTTNDYYAHVRRGDLRALSGDRVKSFEEVEIANFLSLNGIIFEYERPYREHTATSRHRQYCPDFYLPDYDIYIEHFALDEAGRAPQHFLNYQEQVNWKRSIHNRYGTRLIETYTWERAQGVLHGSLESRLRREGVALRPVPIAELLDQLRRQCESWLTKLIGTCLKHIKTSALSRDELARRAEHAVDTPRWQAFLTILDAARERYEARLAADGGVDFDDVINTAADEVCNGGWTVPYKYVLVDEFQDISAGRMKLIEALSRPGLAYFLVGDDWQSIYRFAGSDVGLVQGCHEYLGCVKNRSLSKTFRYGNDILEPTSMFVQRNPSQTQRNLQTDQTAGQGITVVGSTTASGGIELALNDIAEQERSTAVGSSRPEVLILGRYNRSENDVPRTASRGRGPLSFSTVHRAKGQETEYVVVLDLQDAWNGFPAQIEDDPLLDLVMPTTKGQSFAHAEERRLFYVATTRAKRGVYLIADRDHPSTFVQELTAQHPGIRRIGMLAQNCTWACPRCDGHLVESQSGKTLRCINHPQCTHQAPRCPECRQGYVLVGSSGSTCTSEGCTASTSVCPSCGIGVLVERPGPYGRFLGCTEYWSEPPCEYSEKYYDWPAETAPRGRKATERRPNRAAALDTTTSDESCLDESLSEDEIPF